jgi:hypothetical protein
MVDPIIPEVIEEAETPNPFAINAQALRPFNDSISAAGQTRNRSRPFGTSTGGPSIFTTRASALGDFEQVYTDASGRTVLLRTPTAPRIIELDD